MKLAMLTRHMPAVLVVDDDQAITDLLRNILSRQGFEVETAANGNEGLSIAGQKVFDLIISDLMMPQLDGLGLLAKLQADNELKNIPVILLTAVDEIDKKINAWDAGVSAYMTKPFSEQEVLAVVEAMLKKNRNMPVETVSTSDKQKSIFVRDAQTLIKIAFKDILWCEALGDYVAIKTKKGNFKSHTTMKSIEKKLPERSFARIHRSFIVALEQIIEITSNGVKVGDELLPVSQSYRNSLLERINIV